jgi:ADP-L-glycero-D-manno-heptose 6-epimerase
MKNSIVVTGGAGFIGANIVAALNERGQDDIVVVDQLGTGEKWKNLRGLRFRGYMDKDDFLAGVQARSLDAPAAVLHMGACSATTERDADYLMRNNTLFTQALCDWALECGARFVTASSAATYGDGSRGYDDADEATPTLRPLNMYGYSKQLFDEWALREGLYGRIVGLKFFNVFGPREAHKGDMRSVVHKAWQQVRAEGRISLFRSAHPQYRDGEQMRDFICVGDAVDVVLHFVENRGANGLFNCGTGKARTWLDLARAVFAAMGREEAIHWVDMPAALAGKYQYFTQASTQKLREAGGYAAPFTSLEEGVAEYVAWLEAEEA